MDTLCEIDSLLKLGIFCILFEYSALIDEILPDGNRNIEN